MFCYKCGKEFDDSHSFCPNCGAEKSSPPIQPPPAPTPVASPTPPPAQPYYPQQYPPTPAPKKSRRGIGCGGAILLLILLIVVIVIIFSLSKKETPTTTPAQTTTQSSQTTSAPPPAASINTTFEQVGSYRTASVQVEPYYVANPTKSAIRQFCEGKRQEAKQEQENGRQLILNFYDDLAHTPNYTQGYDPEDPNSEPYFVCTCLFTPDTFAVDLADDAFYKAIPEN